MLRCVAQDVRMNRILKDVEQLKADFPEFDPQTASTTVITTPSVMWAKLLKKMALELCALANGFDPESASEDMKDMSAILAPEARERCLALFNGTPRSGVVAAPKPRRSTGGPRQEEAKQEQTLESWTKEQDDQYHRAIRDFVAKYDTYSFSDEYCQDDPERMGDLTRILSHALFRKYALHTSPLTPWSVMRGPSHFGVSEEFESAQPHGIQDTVEEVEKVAIARHPGLGTESEISDAQIVSTAT
jgi:hypothetical protein